jgi:hypothetical protein
VVQRRAVSNIEVGQARLLRTDASSAIDVTTEAMLAAVDAG